MRTEVLPTPRPVAIDVASPAPAHPELLRAPAAGRAPAREIAAPARGLLDPPARASRRLRHLFHPRDGWFRKLERNVNLFFSRNVLHRIPGIHLPYDRQLRRDLALSVGDVALPDLPRAFDGLRVLLITDVHAGAFVSRTVLLETFERLLAVDPDVVLLGGDLITSRVEDFVAHRAAFRRLAAPLGVYGVFGNHDHYSGRPARLRRLVERTGVRVLHNRAVELRRRGATLSLAGVDDLLIGEPDLDAALAGTRRPVVLLSHNPDFLFEAAARGVSLVLSGHTHAGQVRVPGLPVIVRQSRYRLDEGRYRTGDTELVVSRGLGVDGVPLRLACPPEAVLLTLRRAAQ